MTHVFPSEPWATAYCAAINGNDTYREAGAAWTHGPVAIVCRAEPNLGLTDDVGIWLDLHEGACRTVRLVDSTEAARAPFCITGTYVNWKAVIRGELEPIKGILLGRLELIGDLATVVRFIGAAQAMVASAGRVPTRFLDEHRP